MKIADEIWEAFLAKGTDIERFTDQDGDVDIEGFKEYLKNYDLTLYEEFARVTIL